MATSCLRGGCRAPEEQNGEARQNGEEARGAARRQRQLQSAIQRSAAPGRVADDYAFGHTLGAHVPEAAARARRRQARSWTAWDRVVTSARAVAGIRVLLPRFARSRRAVAWRVFVLRTRA